MTKFISTPIQGVDFASVSDEALSLKINGETTARLRIDAGGRLNWSNGTDAADINLYRSNDGELKTDDVLISATGLVTVTTNGEPTSDLPDGAIAIDTYYNKIYYRSQSVWRQVTGGGGGTSVTIDDNAPPGASPGELWYNTLLGKFLIFYDSFWVEVASSGPSGPEGPEGPVGPRGLRAFLYSLERTGANQYQVGEIVFYEGDYYIAVQNNDATIPTNTTYWSPYSIQGPPGNVEGSVLGDLDDVIVAGVADGEYLQFDGTNWVAAVSPSNEPIGFENRLDSAISFDNATLTFSIEPATTEYVIWCAGRRYIKDSLEDIAIPNITGLYYIYFSDLGVLSYRTSYFVWETDTPIAYVYWNSTNTQAYFFADERHGITLDWATHEYLHRTRGAVIASGFGANSFSIGQNGSLDSHAQFALAGGTFFDEDLQVDIVHSATPAANSWEQILEGIAEIPVFYKSNIGWIKDNATEFAFKQGTSRPRYNLNNAPNWTTVDAPNNKFTISWIIATNNINSPVIAILGQNYYNTIGEAEAALWGDLNLDGFPIFEFRPLHKVVFQGTDSYTNSVNAVVSAIYDLRRVLSDEGSIPTTPISDHGSMTGLQDDDHTQYLNTTRHDETDHTTVLGDRSINDLGDVTVTSPAVNEILAYTAGGEWENTSEATLTNLTLTGNLTVSGTTTTFNTEEISIADNIIVLNSNVTGAPSENAGIEVERGSETNVSVIWNEGTDHWTFTNDGTNYINLAPGGATVSTTAPASPDEGALWFDSDTAQTYVYYDSQWVEVGASALAVVVSETAPDDPLHGQLWFNSVTGGTFIYYTPVWIEVGAAPYNALLAKIENKGDLIVGTSGSEVDNLAVGTNGYFLKANSSTTTGLEWSELTSDGLKANLASPTFTGTVVLPATTTIGTVTSDEHQRLSGVTSSVQTQLNEKASTGKAIAMAIVFGG